MRIVFSQSITWILFFTVLGSFYFASAGDVGAEDAIDYQSLERAGYGEVANVLRQMTPEQRHAVLMEAEKKSKELESMTQQQREQLVRETQQTYQKTNFHNVNVPKLDTGQYKSLGEIRKDMRTFRASEPTQKR